MYRMHLKTLVALTVLLLGLPLAAIAQEATARLNGDFAGDIAAYDRVHDHILKLADLLSAGIMQQFSDQLA